MKCPLPVRSRKIGSGQLRAKSRPLRTHQSAAIYDPTSCSSGSVPISKDIACGYSLEGFTTAHMPINPAHGRPPALAPLQGAPGFLVEVHETEGTVILWLAGLHVLIACRHQFVLWDGTCGA